jgi:hypothetical protein
VNERNGHVLYVRVPDPMYAALRAKAEAEDRTIAGLIRLATRDYLARLPESSMPAGVRQREG